MFDKSELEKARTEMFEVLDAKLVNVPEWRAFRAIDRALSAVSTQAAPMPKRVNVRPNRGRGKVADSYGDLALRALREAGSPMRTDEMVEYMRPLRELNADQKKQKINIQSALSRDKRIESILWRDGPAWWFAGKAPPSDTAGTLLEAPAATH